MKKIERIQDASKKMEKTFRIRIIEIPVMAAIAVRKKVISIGRFSPCFRLQSLQCFFICEIKSRAILCIECTENQRKIGLSEMSSMS